MDRFAAAVSRAFALLAALSIAQGARAQPIVPFATVPPEAPPARVIVAKVAAIEQPIIYNRFGSFNPAGMIYALERDLVTVEEDGQPITRLRADKRPRPLVLRGNVGDELVVEFTNRLPPRQPNWNPATERLSRAAPTGGVCPGADWSCTRTASIVVHGITTLGANDRERGIVPIAPGETQTYRFRLEREGAYLFTSLGAPAGGEGDGGSLTHGLFGVIVVEPPGSRWYRSQVDARRLAAARAVARGGAFLDYGATDPDARLDMLAPIPDEQGRFELLSGDLSAVVDVCPAWNAGEPGASCAREGLSMFREFVVVFHDELKTFYPDRLRELRELPENDPDAILADVLKGVRDGFAINYGASGMGSALLANRKGFGPAKDCVECAYEEFFLQSWVNGDPALLPVYADDPSNVFHSYLGDPVVFRNLHAGPKETHVFHLHAHQWLAQRNDDSGLGGPTLGVASSPGTYLDSQTIAPLQSFSYPIYYGGSGNLNLTPGDSIFHCHLYPHFAQGMWGLWRVHDVFEDGRRRLPDGEFGPGEPLPPPDVVPTTGTPIPAVVPLPGRPLPPAPTADMTGFPFYIEGRAGHRAPQPPRDIVRDAGLPRHVVTGGTRTMAGIEAADQAALGPQGVDEILRLALVTGDMSVELETATLEILPADGTERERRAMAFHAGRPESVTMADGTVGRRVRFAEIEPGLAADPNVLPPVKGRVGWTSRTPAGRDHLPSGKPAVFWVNGNSPDAPDDELPGAPGAPFADPCVGVPRDQWVRYRVAAIQADLVVNDAGWHDPQARLNVLASDADRLQGRRIGRGTADDVKPFVFRAHSGDCILFEHENRLPKELALDDFQVRTPTDTVGQHIHLVKFDVLASDGSANGFNYEDGTFARDAILERVHAATAPGGRVVGGSLREPAPGEYQTTIQRWYADPLLWGPPEAGPGSRPVDKTLQSVFTHDHFGPSSIQQHGFYAALVIEPRDSIWWDRVTASDVTNLPGPDGIKEGRGVGTQMRITPPVDGGEPYAEFALVIADFALLYEPCGADGPCRDPVGPEANGLELTAHLVATRPPALLSDSHRAALAARRQALAREKPIAPPRLPEAISTDHHDPYLLNYRNEPLALRIGERTGSGTWRQKAGLEGDLAAVFSSVVHGRDPATEPFLAQEGEKLRIRLIQGAQEVQHVFAVQGLSWPRELNDPNSVRVGAQEIGISEHFELDLLVPGVPAGAADVDLLYQVTTVDGLWNGAWGLLRVHRGDPAAVPAEPLMAGVVPGIAPAAAPAATPAAVRAQPPTSTPSLAYRLFGTPAGVPAPLATGRRPHGPPVRLGWPERWRAPTVERPAAAPAADIGRARVVVDRLPPGTRSACAPDDPRRRYVLEAWRVDTWLGQRLGSEQEGLRIGAQGRLRSRAALAWVMLAHERPTMATGATGEATLEPSALERDPELWVARRAAVRQAHRELGEVPPLVLRAKAGECLEVILHNCLAGALTADGKELARCRSVAPEARLTPVDQLGRGDANDVDVDLLPKIVGLNLQDLSPSYSVGLRPDMLGQDFLADPQPIGGNIPLGPDGQSDPTRLGGLRPGEARALAWYAGILTTRSCAEIGAPEEICRNEGVTTWPERRALPLGIVNLVATGDPLEHGQHHIVGALVVETAESRWLLPVDPGSARPDRPRDWIRVDEPPAIGVADAGRPTLDVLRNGGLEARILVTNAKLGHEEWRREHVLIYADGLGRHYRLPGSSTFLPVPSCRVCDDSYDLGSQAVSGRSAPFFARLGLQPWNETGGSTGPAGPIDYNRRVFPTTFFAAPDPATRTLRAVEGETVSLRVAQPYGRARQHAFTLLGHDYPDLLPHFGSPSAVLMAPGRAFTATLCRTWDPRERFDGTSPWYGYEDRPCLRGGARAGRWLWRDGPAMFFAGGMWGVFDVAPASSP
ncbi:MAG: hypothetical protein KatS3mg117_3365 [Geminicoccaceae bacterium]|nr:MAG: hypothetical protein KatS3mg117_3365 [Geminicoccaceae bacterium]